MKFKIFLFTIIFLFNKVVAQQSILGLWQENSPEVSDSYYNTYEFKTDGTFKFNTNGYFGLGRVTTIGGKYKLLNKQIQISVEYTVELVGGKITRSEFAGTATHRWVIEGGQLKKTILSAPIKSVINFEFSTTPNSEEAKTQLLLLDKGKFYKILQE